MTVQEINTLTIKEATQQVLQILDTTQVDPRTWKVTKEDKKILPLSELTISIKEPNGNYKSISIYRNTGSTTDSVYAYRRTYSEREEWDKETRFKLYKNRKTWESCVRGLLSEVKTKSKKGFTIKISFIK